MPTLCTSMSMLGMFLQGAWIGLEPSDEWTASALKVNKDLGYLQRLALDHPFSSYGLIRKISELADTSDIDVVSNEAKKQHSFLTLRLPPFRLSQWSRSAWKRARSHAYSKPLYLCWVFPQQRHLPRTTAAGLQVIILQKKKQTFNKFLR